LAEVFGEAHAYVQACEKYKMFVEREKLAHFPLILGFVEEAYRQWNLNLIREIHPPSSAQHKWIIMVTDYFTKWVEVVLARNE